MFIIFLYRILFGSIKVNISGNYCERILNLCLVNKITIWGISNTDDGISLYMYPKDIYNLRRIRNHCQIKIVKKRGLVFYLKKHKFRPSLPVGVAVFLLTVYILTFFVWNITIVGVKNTDIEKIEKFCSDNGIRYGVPTKSINKDYIRDKLPLEVEGIAWSSVNIEGSRVSVNVTEIKNDFAEKNPCNLVASNDGVIKSITVTTGEKVAEVGQAVQKGDILVSGIIENGNVIAYKRADATVIADVFEDVSFRKPILSDERIYTGEERKDVLEFFALKVPLFIGDTVGRYDEYFEKRQMKLFGQNLPIILYTKKYDTYSVQTMEISKADIIDRIENELKEKYEKYDGFQIISREISQDNNEISANYRLKYEKNIVSEENLQFYTLK